ncbi:hypothetical protein ACFL5F_04610 [Planctomycetota bacterium]
MIETLDRLFRTHRQEKLYFVVPERNVLDDNFVSTIIQPNQSYMQVRLCKMYLRDSREYWKCYNPLGIVVTDFLYGRNRETVPSFVDNRILQSIESYLEGQYVDFRNTRVIGPIPYSGDDFGLFLGLFRLQVDDLAENLFRTLETVVKAFDATSLSRYLDIAKPLSEGLSDLLNLKQLGLRFGFRDVFIDKEGDTHQLRQMYIAYVDCPKGTIPTEMLWVKDCCLYVGKTKNAIKELSKYDYCLLKVEHLPTRNDYRTLPFYPTWEEVRDLAVAGQVGSADWKRIELHQQIAASPDLTEEHREALIEMFEIRYLKLASEKVERKATHRSPVRAALDTVPMRGSQRLLDARTSLQETAALADRAKYPHDVVKGIMSLYDNWKRITKQIDFGSDFKLSDDSINEQISVLKSIHKGQKKPNPGALADAITLATCKRMLS